MHSIKKVLIIRDILISNPLNAQSKLQQHIYDHIHASKKSSIYLHVHTIHTASGFFFIINYFETAFKNVGTGKQQVMK